MSMLCGKFSDSWVRHRCAFINKCSHTEHGCRIITLTEDAFDNMIRVYINVYRCFFAIFTAHTNPRTPTITSGPALLTTSVACDTGSQ